MKLYDCQTAPSPRRVRIFVAEKGIEIPKVQVDLRAGEQLTPEFKSRNPQCTVPVLELDDGTCISGTRAICRYVEEIHPEPPLLGRDALSKAMITMWNYRMEQEGFYAVAEAFRNSAPGLTNRALTGPHDFAQIPELAERGRRRVAIFLETLNDRLAECEFVAGDSYSLADITALVTVDFCEWVKVEVPTSHSDLSRWHSAVSSRASAKA